MTVVWLAFSPRCLVHDSPLAYCRMMDDVLRAELLRRAEVDQAARVPWDAAATARADEENLPWLKDVVTRLGWPGKSLVGVDGAEAAWQLAQHADRDPAFQRQCLDLIAPMVETGEPDEIDQRRAAVGLGPLAEYLLHFGVWRCRSGLT